jgi:dienelactone hydrolase
MRALYLAVAATALIAGCAQTAPTATDAAPIQAAAAPAVAPSAATTSAAAPAAPRPSASLAPPPDAPPPKPQPPGRYAVSAIAEPSLLSHTVYRPADLGGITGSQRLPIVAWGNGACSNAGLLFQNFLRQIASHGYIVIASGPKDAPLPSFSSGGGVGDETPNPDSVIASGRTTDQDLIKAIDWAIAENARAGSPYAGKIATDRVAVMGQSCGGLQATAVAADPRIDTVVIWNSGVFSAGANSAGASMSGATKESLANFHAPVAYFPGGPSDLAYGNSKDDFSRITTAQAFFGSINVGHGGTFRHPGGGWFGEVGLAWLDWHLKGDSAAAKYFEGADCILCRNPIWEVAKKNME